MIERLTVVALSYSRTNLVDWNWMDGRARGGGDISNGDAIIDNRVVVDVEVIDDDGVVINLRQLSRPDAVIARMWIAKMLRRHKGVTIRAQPETKGYAYATAIIDDAHARLIGRARR